MDKGYILRQKLTLGFFKVGGSVRETEEIPGTNRISVLVA